MTEMQHFERLVYCESIIDQDTRTAIRTRLCLKTKNMTESLQCDSAVIVATCRAGEMPSWSRVDGSIATKGCCGLDNQRVETLTIGRVELDGSHQLTLSRNSTASACIACEYQYLLRY